MFKSLALISVLISATRAQGTNATSAANTTSSAANTTTNPLIPAGISTPCTTFLNSLNSDSSLTGCLSTLTNVTSAFAPGSTTPSSSDVSSSLTSLCADSVTGACPESLIRPKITAFYAACPAELTTSFNKDVVRIYDVLYSLLPLRTSICSKDESDNYCVQGPSATARELDEDANQFSLGISQIMSLLYYIKSDDSALRRRDELSPAILPNLTTYEDNNLPFAFFTPSLNATQLCVTCARLVLTAYINFESNSPYAPGLNSSLLLSTQSALFNAVQAKCPVNFLSGIVQAAGGLSGSSSAAIPRYGVEYQYIIALLLGAVTLVVSFAL